MKTVDELLDELVSEVEIKTAAENAWGSDGGKAKNAARAAVDAKIKEMQDRIAELERDNSELMSTLRKYDSALIRKLMSESTRVSEIK